MWLPGARLSGFFLIFLKVRGWGVSLSFLKGVDLGKK